MTQNMTNGSGHSRRPLTPGRLMLLLTWFVAAACAIEEPIAESSGTSQTPTDAAAQRVSFRPVLTVLPPVSAGGFDEQSVLPGGLDQDGLSDPSTIGGDEEVVLAETELGTITARYHLGPQLLTGSAIETAEPEFVRSYEDWTVHLVFRAGPDGIDRFNTAAALCAKMAPECPDQTLAMVLDGEVISAPVINAPEFERDQIIMSGLSEEKVRQLSAVLPGP